MPLRICLQLNLQPLSYPNNRNTTNNMSVNLQNNFINRNRMSMQIPKGKPGCGSCGRKN